MDCEKSQDFRKLSVPATYPWPTISRAISDRDEMLAGENFAHYLAVGRSAMNNINAAIAIRGTNVSNILDMPCGHGRVTRVLRAAFPSAHIVVSDIDTDAIEFCARNFDAEPIPSVPDFSQLDFKQSFDLIWVGSLITHLPPDTTTEFFRFVSRHLTPTGVAVISSHGPFVAGRIQASVLQGAEGYGTENGAARVMLERYFKDGFGYADYPTTDTSVQHYGISLATREWIKATVELVGCTTLFYTDHAFDNHHDIVAFSRL